MIDLYALEARRDTAKYLNGRTLPELIGWSFLAGCLMGAGLCLWAAVTL